MPGLVTVTETVPAVASAVPGTIAVSWLLVINVVESALEPQFTTEVPEKFVPLTVKVMAAAVALWFALFGMSCVMLGVTPGWAGVVAFVPYPQPSSNAANATSSTVEIIFIWILPGGMFPGELV